MSKKMRAQEEEAAVEKQIRIIENKNNTWHKKTVLLALAAIAIIGIFAYLQTKNTEKTKENTKENTKETTKESVDTTTEKTPNIETKQVIPGYIQNCESNKDCPPGTKCHKDSCIPLDMKTHESRDGNTQLEKTEAKSVSTIANKSRIGEESGLYRVVVEN